MKKTLIAVIALSLAAAGFAPAAQADDRAVVGALVGAVIGYQLSRDRGHDHGHHGHHGHRHYPPVSVVIGVPPPVVYSPAPYPPPNYPYPYPEYVRPLVCHKIPVYDHWGNLTHYQQICRR